MVDVAGQVQALLARKQCMLRFLTVLQANARTAGNTIKDHVSHMRRAMRYCSVTRGDAPDFTEVLALLDSAGKGASKKSLHVDRRRQDASELVARGQWASTHDLRFACRAATPAFRRIVDAFAASCRAMPAPCPPRTSASPWAGCRPPSTST